VFQTSGAERYRNKLGKRTSLSGAKPNWEVDETLVLAHNKSQQNFSKISDGRLKSWHGRPARESRVQGPAREPRARCLSPVPPVNHAQDARATLKRPNLLV
jgi:hypothetical protein